MRKTKVLIIEDSSPVREILTHIIREDPRLEVQGAVSTAEEGLDFIKKHHPDVISLDIRLPGMNGFEATTRIMSTSPTPIVVVSNNVQGDDLQISMNALRAGALSVIEKPVGLSHRDYEKYAAQICNQLVAMSTVKLVRQRIARPLKINSSTPHPHWNANQFKMLAVVASTGGPGALVQLFQALPANFPLPIVLVQHITGCFLQSFAEWLGQNCPFRVNVVYSGEVPRPGIIYVAPPDHHLEVGENHLLLSRSPPVCSQRPSGTVLFRSLAHSLRGGGLGVILTGMGNDGADGLLDMRKAGGYTVAEDESTAVIYGMPAAAVQLGAACEILPLDKIATHIIGLLEGRIRP